MDESDFAQFHSGVKRGDIAGVCGFPGKCSLRHERDFRAFQFPVLSIKRIVKIFHLFQFYKCYWEKQTIT